MSFCRADVEEKLAFEAATLSSNSSTEDLTEMRKHNISIYGALVGGTFLLALAGACIFLYITVSASQNLHNKMFEKLVGAAIYFFDTNPAGKCHLINGQCSELFLLPSKCLHCLKRRTGRFSKDHKMSVLMTPHTHGLECRYGTSRWLWCEKLAKCLILCRGMAAQATETCQNKVMSRLFCTLHCLS